MNDGADDGKQLDLLLNARRLVVKIGSSLLIDKSTGELNRPWLESLAEDLAARIDAGQQIVLVSSGAIGLGRSYLELQPGQRRLDQHQAAAAAGQVLLAHAYQELMGRHGIKVAQVLLTPEGSLSGYTPEFDQTRVEQELKRIVKYFKRLQKID